MIATEWKEFKEIDWETVYSQMTKPAFVFDGRLILDAEKLRKIGFTVRVLPTRYRPSPAAHARGRCSMKLCFCTFAHCPARLLRLQVKVIGRGDRL